MPSYNTEGWPPNRHVRNLLHYLDELHREAGRPSMSEIAAAVSLAKNTVYDFLTGRRMINAGNLALLVTYLDGDTAAAERLRKKAAGAWAGEGAVRRRAAGDDNRPWMIPPVERERVYRPGPATSLIALLDEAPGVVIGVYGAGGFGKTTLVAEVCREEAVDAAFPGGLLWVTVGRSVTESQLAAKIGDVAYQLTGERPLLTDPQQAGFHLGRVLDTRPDRTLLVVDDVWLGQHLRPFLTGGRSCARIFTTRNHRILPSGHTVRVEQMTPDEAILLLTRGVPHLKPEQVAQLAGPARGWPVLLDLTNRALHRALRSAPDTDAGPAVGRIAARLAYAGPTALDPVGEVSDEERHEAVAATVNVGLEMLPPAIRRCYRQLGVFAPDASIPLEALELLWRKPADVQRICEDLFDLSMVVGYRRSPPAVELHGVFHAYLRQLAGPEQLAADNERLLTAAAGLVGAADGQPAAWWRLTDEMGYLRAHLIDHLTAAGRHAEALWLVTDLRWAELRIRSGGPAEFESDVEKVLSAGTGDATAKALQRSVGRSAHMLGPITPESALGAVLASRIDGEPGLSHLSARYLQELACPRIVNRAALPDKAHPSQIRTLVGHLGKVTAVAVAPDGAWLATAGTDATVRTWKGRTGAETAVLSGHTDLVNAVAIAPDGTWLATSGDDRTLRIWNVDGSPRGVPMVTDITVSALAATPDGTALVTAGGADNDLEPNVYEHGVSARAVPSFLGRHAGWVYAVAVSPDGAWTATAGADGTVHLWDRSGSRQAVVLTGHTSWINSVAVAPDGSWLVSAGADGTIRLWDRCEGAQVAVLTGHAGAVNAVAVAPDGSWLVSAGDDGTVRLWNAGPSDHQPPVPGPGPVHAAAFTADGSRLALAGHGPDIRVRAGDGDEVVVGTGHSGPIRAVAIAPQGTWLATAGADGTVRLAMADGARPPLVCTGHTGPVNAVAIAPDGSWLVAAGNDGAIRRWSPSGGEGAVLSELADWVLALAIAPDGSWLAGAGADGTIRIWGHPRWPNILTGHTGAVNALVIVPDGSWLASAGADGTIRIWGDPGRRAVLTGHTGAVNALAIAPDGSWLASTGTDRTLRVWSPSQPRPVAAMRVSGRLHGCLWRPRGNELHAFGEAGLYTFEFQPEAVR